MTSGTREPEWMVLAREAAETDYALDEDGNEIDISDAAHDDPDWAANRIKFERGLLGKALALIDALVEGWPHKGWCMKNGIDLSAKCSTCGAGPGCDCDCGGPCTCKRHLVADLQAIYDKVEVG